MNFSKKNNSLSRNIGKHKKNNRNLVSKPIKSVLTIVFLVVFSFTSYSQKTTIDQSINYKSGNPAEWSPVLDAIIAAPKNHKVLLENDKVRVLEVTLPPGEVENLHHHQWPSVLYIQEAGDFTDSDAQGNVIFDTRTIPEPLKFPITMYKDPEAPHTVTNLSKTETIRLIRVEMKQ